MGGVDNNTNLYCPKWGYCLSEVAVLFFLFHEISSNFSIHPNIKSIKGGLFSDFGFLAQSTEQNQCLPLFWWTTTFNIFRDKMKTIKLSIFNGY